jgi:hypothetical protein
VLLAFDGRDVALSKKLDKVTDMFNCMHFEKKNPSLDTTKDHNSFTRVWQLQQITTVVIEQFKIVKQT